MQNVLVCRNDSYSLQAVTDVIDFADVTDSVIIVTDITDGVTDNVTDVSDNVTDVT